MAALPLVPTHYTKETGSSQIFCSMNISSWLACAIQEHWHDFNFKLHVSGVKRPIRFVAERQGHGRVVQVAVPKEIQQNACCRHKHKAPANATSIKLASVRSIQGGKNGSSLRNETRHT